MPEVDAREVQVRERVEACGFETIRKHPGGGYMMISHFRGDVVIDLQHYPDLDAIEYELENPLLGPAR